MRAKNKFSRRLDDSGDLLIELPESDLNELLTERDALQAELERLKNPLISVEYRFPEFNEEVLLNSDHAAGYILGFYDSEQLDFLWVSNGRFNVLKGVTHWMPLPKLEGKGDE